MLTRMSTQRYEFAILLCTVLSVNMSDAQDVQENVVFDYTRHSPLRVALEDVTMHMEPFYCGIGLLLLLK